MAVLVGTALLLINHGDHLLQEPVCDYFFIKAGLCYAVPFTVSLVSAALSARSEEAARLRRSSHDG